MKYNAAMSGHTTTHRSEVNRRSHTVAPQSSIVDDWTHEGPDDPEGDRLLLAEALAESKRYRAHPQEHLEWEAFKAKLGEADAAGELPD